MINPRYKRVTGTRAGQLYVVMGPLSEIETPLLWVLHNVADARDKATVALETLNDSRQWEGVA